MTGTHSVPSFPLLSLVHRRQSRGGGHVLSTELSQGTVAPLQYVRQEAAPLRYGDGREAVCLARTMPCDLHVVVQCATGHEGTSSALRDKLLSRRMQGFAMQVRRGGACRLCTCTQNSTEWDWISVGTMWISARLIALLIRIDCVRSNDVAATGDDGSTYTPHVYHLTETGSGT